jgi:transcriptional regulator with XRE-family HTH domain
MRDPSIAKELIHIGNKLKIAREARGFSIKDASKFLYMSTSRLEAIERGEKNYSLTLLVAMCDYYKVDVLDVVR